VNKLRSFVIAVAVGASVVGLPSIAQACSSEGCGDPALAWDQPYYKPGEVATGKMLMTWPKKSTRSAGAHDAGPYYIYLRPMSSKLGRNPESDPSATRVGTLALGPLRRHRMASIKAEFTVPALERGKYLVQTCAAGCSLRPGFLADSQITIVTSDVEERDLITDQIKRVEQMVLRARSATARMSYKARKELRKAKAALQTTLYELDTGVRYLEDEVEHLRQRLNDRPRPQGSQLGIMTLAGSILLTGALLRRRRSSPPEHRAM
jgi:hypothetical protein